MKVFIAGSRLSSGLNPVVMAKLNSIQKKEYHVLIGDCYGVDSAVQSFYAQRHYDKLTVYASNGLARNNVGNWTVRNIAADRTKHGRAFYEQKDIAMTNDADCGFMIWDGKSKGTLNNIIRLSAQDKTVLVYNLQRNQMYVISNTEDLLKWLSKCAIDTSRIVSTLQKQEKQISIL